MKDTANLDNSFIKDGSSIGVIDEKTQAKILTNFVIKISNQENMPPKYQKLVNEHFWELI